MANNSHVIPYSVSTETWQPGTCWWPVGKWWRYAILDWLEILWVIPTTLSGATWDCCFFTFFFRYFVFCHCHGEHVHSLQCWLISKCVLRAVCFLMLNKFSRASGNISSVIKLEQNSNTSILGLVRIGQLGTFECKPHWTTNLIICIYFSSLIYKVTVELRFQWWE